MTREDYLKAKIKEYGMTQREFAANIGMPSSTLFSYCVMWEVHQ